jgi:hypothetical protein
MRLALQILAFVLCSTAVFGQAPDFQLRDASVSSQRRGTIVSPRDYIMQVSGYYFGSAT